MGVSTFKGGVHPYDGKELAMDKAIVDLRPEGLMVYPLSQHIGAPAKPLVAQSTDGTENCGSGRIYFRSGHFLCFRHGKEYRKETDGGRQYGRVYRGRE